MKARKFNGGIMPKVNEIWASKVLGMKLNPHQGIDLIGTFCVSEVKFCLDGEGYNLGWTVQEHQMSYPEEYPDKSAYWSLGTYTLTSGVKDIETENPNELENLVQNRELWVVRWSWMNQFPPHKTSGRTDKTDWNYTFRYPKKRLLPETIREYEIEKGTVYITEGIHPGDLLYLEDGVPF